MFSFSFIESVRRKLSASMEYRQISRGSMRTRELDAILVGKLCFAMGLYATNVIRRIQSFVKICYIGLLRVIYAVLSNDRERERERI